MEIEPSAVKNVLLLLLRDFSSTHTVTSLAQELGVTRVGAWKILKRLESTQFLNLRPIGAGKTSTFLVTLNWDNLLVEKSLSLYLTEEALLHKRWRSNFVELEEAADFLILFGSILHSPNEAHDIDIIGVVSQRKGFIRIQQILDKIQKTQSKKIHSINFTSLEFKQELLKPNKVFIEAIKKGIILFGQENFIKFMSQVHQK